MQNIRNRAINWFVTTVWTLAMLFCLGSWHALIELVDVLW